MYLPPGTGAPGRRPKPRSALARAKAATKRSWSSRTTSWCADYVLTQLHSLGYVTLDAANAAEALAIVDAGNAFDLLFTDVIMPGAMNGRQLADEIAKTQARAEGAVHLGLYRECHHSSRPARRRRAAARQAVSQVGYGDHDPQGARRLRPPSALADRPVPAIRRQSMPTRVNRHLQSGLVRPGAGRSSRSGPGRPHSARRASS